MDSSSRPAFLLVSGRSIGLAASFAIGIVLARLFDPTVFGTYKQFFLLYATLYGVLQLGMAESLYYFVPRRAQHTGRYVCNAMVMLAATGLACTLALYWSRAVIAGWLGPELAEHDVPLGLFLTFTLAGTVLEIVMVSRGQHLAAAATYALSDIVRTVLFIVPAAYLDTILVGMVIILILLVVILALIVNALRRFLNQKDLSEEDREVVNSPISFGSVTSSPGFVFLVIFVVGTISFKGVIDGLYSIGVQKNYEPKQPIAFSHKIHAGQYEIDCNYCHTGAMKGKQANIPSANICMNCHTQIKQGTITGTAEIEKIYAAIGFDPNTSTYTGVTKPIEWVRIHNLPDLAYFNHSQHVNVAGIICQTCHGPIQEMDVVKQYNLLTMGWCIDCHRKTDVNTKGNAYYDKLVELHGSNGKKAMKVEDIGGLECAKCHY